MFCFYSESYINHVGVRIIHTYIYTYCHCHLKKDDVNWHVFLNTCNAYFYTIYHLDVLSTVEHEVSEVWSSVVRCMFVHFEKTSIICSLLRLLRLFELNVCYYRILTKMNQRAMISFHLWKINRNDATGQAARGLCHRCDDWILIGKSWTDISCFGGRSTRGHLKNPCWRDLTMQMYGNKLKDVSL